MKNSQVKLLSLSVILLLSAILIVNFGCGGSDSTGVIPGNISQAPAVQLISKEVSGYIFATNGLTSSQTGEEVSQRFVILDVPLSGEDAFLNQVSFTLQEDYPEDWSNPKMQELFNKLSAELSGWQPLSAINGAQLFTVYQDSRSENPLTVGEDGYFEGSVMVASTDDLVKFEVVIGEEDCYAVETIASSDMTASEGDSPSLSACPEVILNFSGWCTIFKVKASPVINLKEAGLTFALNDSSMGCITENPIYLRCRGSRKYNVAYGIFYANPGLTTPIDTTITASTTTGFTLSIFTEVIGSSASISGHVGGAGVVPVFGFVYSFGCHAFDCLDEAGDYHLSSVFQGHNRKVVAVYWLVQPDGRWKKYREERTVEFFSEDLSGFDLPDDFQPPLPSDAFYRETAFKVAVQKWKWEDELGTEAGVQKTVDWLNGLVFDGPPVPEGVEGGLIDSSRSTSMWVGFEGGMWIQLYGEAPWDFLGEEALSSGSQRSYSKYNGNNNSQKFSSSNINKNATTVSNSILILAPFVYSQRVTDFAKTVYDDIANDLEAINEDPNIPGYEIKKVVTDKSDLYEPQYLAVVNNERDPNTGIRYMDVSPVLDPNVAADPNVTIVRPEDFRNIDNYGIIYIATHGFLSGIAACPFYYCWDNASGEIVEDTELRTWINNNQDVMSDPNSPGTPGTWYLSFVAAPDDPNAPIRTGTTMIVLKSNFFTGQGVSYANSIVYIDACQSMDFHNQNGGFNDAKAYLGYGNAEGSYIPWTWQISGYFFHYLMYGFTSLQDMTDYNIDRLPALPHDRPMSVREALDVLTEIGANPDPEIHNDPQDIQGNGCTLILDQRVDDEEIYFPVTVNIVVQGE